MRTVGIAAVDSHAIPLGVFWVNPPKADFLPVWRLLPVIWKAIRDLRQNNPKWYSKDEYPTCEFVIEWVVFLEVVIGEIECSAEAHEHIAHLVLREIHELKGSGRFRKI